MDWSGWDGVDTARTGVLESKLGAQSPWSLHNLSLYNVGISWTFSILYDVSSNFGGGLAVLNKAFASTGVLNVIHDSATGNNTGDRWQLVSLALRTALHDYDVA